MLTWLSNIFTRIESFLNLPKFLFNGWRATGRIILTTIVIYFVLVVLLKLFGSRSVSSFSVYDMIAAFTIGSIISPTLFLEEVNLINGVIAIVILFLMQYGLSRILTKWEKLYPKTNPVPTNFYLKGEYKKENMKKMRVNNEEILSAIRREAGTTSDQIYAVLLEANGDLSVIQNVTPTFEEEITKYL